MRRLFLATLIYAMSLQSGVVSDRNGLIYPGYSLETTHHEEDWEKEFRSIPNTESLREYMKRLAAYPHPVGSAYDKSNAIWIESKFKEWGLDAHIETFEVLFPTPRERVIELVAPTKFVAKLQEPALTIDPTSSQQSDQLPTYNAYSPDGDVTAPLVYVNYGTADDYNQLDRMGISVKDTIVIARYGGAWRGIKPKLAAEHGAIGCLIYSDPQDDGFFQGDTYPSGAWRPAEGVQRGSVMDEIYPGDPLTPDVGATGNVKRLPLSEVKTFARVPVMPVSYADAEPLLAALGGPVPPKEWRGALPFTYHVGPGPARVHLKIKSDWDLKTIYDVIATIPGSVYPHQWIIRGNHHDAWVNGAEDPVSAMSALMEEARAFGELLKKGWRPERTIVYCAWDGEEPGVLGSTEWGEEHADELKKFAVAYINSDGNGRGPLVVGGSHTLERFIDGVARDIEDPEKKISVLTRLKFYSISTAQSPEERNDIRQRPDLRIGALGSGSDWEVFLDHLGISSVHLGYGGEDGDGIYHSIYDDYYWFTHFSDKNFSYGRALSQTAGTAVMRLADSDLLPYDFDGFADTVQKYVDDFDRDLKQAQDTIRERNKEIEEGMFSAIADPQKTFVPPAIEDIPPFVNTAPLKNAAQLLLRSAQQYDQALSNVRAGDRWSIGRESLDSVNSILLQSERRLTSPEGLSGRPWYKHLIYAPGSLTGYDVQIFPGVRQALAEKKWKQAEIEIARLATVLQDEAALIDSAATELKRERPSQ